MSIYADGTVVESGLKITTAKKMSTEQFSNFKLQVGQVIREVPIDDPGSLSKKYNECDVIVNEDSAITIYKNVRSSDTFGGLYDFNEMGHVGSATADKANQKDSKELLGSQVLVLCMYGQKERAVIVGALQHSGIRSGSKTTKAPEATGDGDSTSRDEALVKLPTELPGAKKEDGRRILGEFKGLRWSINKDGEFTVMYQGPKDDKGSNTFLDTPSLIKFNKEGDIFLLDSLDQEIKIDHADKKILISSGNGDKIEIDRESSSINIEAGKNKTETYGGKWEINVKGKAVINAETIELNKSVGGDVLTTVTDPVIDSIFGAKTRGVTSVKAG